MKMNKPLQLSPAQLGIIIFEIGVGTSMITFIAHLTLSAGQAVWMSLLLGGLLFYIAAIFAIKLGGIFTAATLADYMPLIWGKYGGFIIIWWYNSLFILTFFLALARFSSTITFFLFDRTPVEIIEISMLMVCVYAAMQKLNTILNLIQTIFFIARPLFFLLWLTSLLNFHLINLKPFWPPHIKSVLSTALNTWPLYSGYEIILLILPLVAPREIHPIKTTGAAFGCMGFFFIMLAVIAVGVLTVAGVNSTTYPILETIRGVQVPGTFIERLEGYFLLLWVPSAFSSLTLLLWTPAQVCMRYYKYNDHRPWLLLFVPLLFTAAIFCDNMEAIDTASNITTRLGLFFSLVIIPASLFLAWRYERGVKKCKKSV